MSKSSEKKKTNDKFLDRIVYLNIILLVLFTIVVLVIFYLTGGMEPSALVYAFFAAFGLENGLCAWIYTVKVKNKESDESGAQDDEGLSEDNPEESISLDVEGGNDEHDLE